MAAIASSSNDCCAFHGDDHYVGMDFVDPPVDFTGMA